MEERRHVSREQWEPLALDKLNAQELRDGARRAKGEVEIYRIPATVGEEEQALELIWVVGTHRAAVASPQGVLWTNAPTPEAALQAWTTGRARGQRLRPR